MQSPTWLSALSPPAPFGVGGHSPRPNDERAEMLFRDLLPPPAPERSQQQASEPLRSAEHAEGDNSRQIVGFSGLRGEPDDADPVDHSYNGCFIEKSPGDQTASDIEESPAVIADDKPSLIAAAKPVTAILPGTLETPGQAEEAPSESAAHAEAVAIDVDAPIAPISIENPTETLADTPNSLVEAAMPMADETSIAAAATDVESPALPIEKPLDSDELAQSEIPKPEPVPLTGVPSTGAAAREVNPKPVALAASSKRAARTEMAGGAEVTTSDETPTANNAETPAPQPSSAAAPRKQKQTPGDVARAGVKGEAKPPSSEFANDRQGGATLMPENAQAALEALTQPNAEQPAAPQPAASPPADARIVAGQAELASSPFRRAGASMASAPAETTASPPQLTSAEQSRFVHRVARAFQAAQQRDGEIRLRLSPPELGSMRLDVKIQDGVMTARIDVDTASARAVLLDNMPALRERLAEQNIRVEQFEVQVGGGQHGGYQSGQDDQPRGRGFAAPLAPSLKESEAPRPAAVSAGAWSGKDRLDVLV